MVLVCAPFSILKRRAQYIIILRFFFRKFWFYLAPPSLWEFTKWFVITSTATCRVTPMNTVMKLFISYKPRRFYSAAIRRALFWRIFFTSCCCITLHNILDVENTLCVELIYSRCSIQHRWSISEHYLEVNIENNYIFR